MPSCDPAGICGAGPRSGPHLWCRAAVRPAFVVPGWTPAGICGAGLRSGRHLWCRAAVRPAFVVPGCNLAGICGTGLKSGRHLWCRTAIRLAFVVRGCDPAGICGAGPRLESGRRHLWCWDRAACSSAQPGPPCPRSTASQHPARCDALCSAAVLCAYIPAGAAYSPQLRPLPRGAARCKVLSAVASGA